MRTVARSLVQATLAIALALGAKGGALAGDASELLERGLTRAFARTETGHSLSYLVGGDPRGITVVFVHGTPGSARTWLSLLASAPPGLRLIAVDRPGFGETRPDCAITSLVGQAAALRPLLGAPGAPPVILVGHSLGGPIVAQAAIDNPDRVAGIVIAAGSLDPAQEKTHPMQYVGAAAPLRWALPRDIRNANSELMALKAELERLAVRLAELRPAVEIVHGVEDRLVPWANVPFMQSRITGSARVNVVRLEGVDHFLPWNSAPALWDAIGRIAATVRRPAP